MLSQDFFNIAIMISGRGSNMQAILEKLSPHKKAQFRVVISDNKAATGLAIAEQYKIPTVVLHKPSFASKPDFEEALLNTLTEHHIHLIVLAGFMTLLSRQIIQHYPQKILNIHPSLLPKYPGLNTHQQVIDNADTETGATVHLVDEGMDTGKIIRQETMKVDSQYDAQSLAEKLLPLEHRLYSSVIQEIVEGRLNLANL